MLKNYPKFKRGECEKIYSRFSDAEKKLISDYLFYRQSCGLENPSDLRRYIIQIRHCIEMDFKEFKQLEQHSRLVVLIKQSHLSNEVKKNLKINLNNFFGEYLFSDWWSAKFKRIYSNKNSDKGDNNKKTFCEADLPTDKELEKMINMENSTYWKTFLLVHASIGARTKETRCIEIKKITFNDDKTATIEIHQTKTGKDKIVFADPQAAFYIKKQIEELKALSRLGKYLFPAPKNINNPISKSIVNYWFKLLSKKATGRYLKPYTLRYKKAKTLYNLAKNNKISEHAALSLMGHSRSMMKVYDTTPKNEEIEILKQQAFNIDISPEKKHELELKIEEQDKKFDRIIDLLVSNTIGKQEVTQEEKQKIKERISALILK